MKVISNFRKLCEMVNESDDHQMFFKSSKIHSRYTCLIYCLSTLIQVAKDKFATLKQGPQIHRARRICLDLH